MNPRELRIGNIVNYRKNISWKQGEIRTMNRDKVTFTNGEFSSYLGLEPVALTEKIIKDFGFDIQDGLGEAHKHVKGWSDAYRFSFIIQYDTDNMNDYGIAMVICQKEFGFSDESQVHSPALIKSVHHLQNLCFELERKELSLSS